MNDNDPIITQEYIDNFNSNPNSTFKLRLNPQFGHLTVGEINRSLFLIRKESSQHGADHYIYIIGSDESEYSNLHTIISGYSNPRRNFSPFQFNIYNNKYLCTNGVTAATCAMSICSSISHQRFMNLSLQFGIDCDNFSDPCFEKGHIRIYDPFFYRIPLADSWDQPEDMLRSPPNLTDEDHCLFGCFPNHTFCTRIRVLYGTCYFGQGYIRESCPILRLNHWKWMKSFLWEVGPLTSRLIVDKKFH